MRDRRTPTPTLALPLLVAGALAACADSATRTVTSDIQTEATPMVETNDPRAEATTDEDSPDATREVATREVATLAAGCFWCVEAVLEQLDGVLDVESGYMGGTVENPSYRQVCSGTTGHAEVVRVSYDPTRISYDDLLAWFWKLHDPTTLNRQGNDVGPQYRSVIFYHSDEQRRAAEASLAAADSGIQDAIVTEITAAGPFFAAGDYHQDYYQLNKAQPYCRAVIRPKLDKLGLDE